MNCISNDDIKIINWIKSARVGATKIMLASTGYFAHHKKRNQLFYQPTDDAAEDFCKTEVDTMLRDVPCMHDIFPYLNKKSSKNTLELKQFLGASLRIKGGDTAGNYRRYTVDIVFYDECESFKKDIDKEGNCFTLGDKRIEGALFPKSVRMTTPRIEEESIIKPEVEQSDYLFEYAVHCPHCDGPQVLSWDNLKWKNKDPSTVHYICEHNQCVIYNDDLSEMNLDGFWIDRKQRVWIDEDDCFRDMHNQFIDTPKSVSFHIWTIYSPFVAWEELVREYIKANNIFKTKGDIAPLKTFRNTTLGLTWREEQGERLDSQKLYDRREPYPNAGFNRRGLVIVAGFDMQGNRVEGVMKAYGLNNESWLIDRFVVYGNPSTPELWDDLEDVCRRTYTREDGIELGIERICFDSGGHSTTEVYDFSKRMGIHWVIPTKGSSTYQQPLARFPDKITDQGVYLTMVGTDTAKDIVYNRLKILNSDLDQPKAAMCHFPLAEWCDEVYFNQLCAESRIPKKVQGRTTMIYDAGSRRNEMIDCEVGCLVALDISIKHYALNLDVLAQKAENPKLISKPMNNFMDAAKKLRVG